MDAEAQLASLKEQVAKEKATSRDNLKKVMKLTQEKKALEEQLASGQDSGGSDAAELASLRAQVEQLQQRLTEKTNAATELEEELEGAKEEVC